MALALSSDGLYMVSVGADRTVLALDWPRRRVLGEDRADDEEGPLKVLAAEFLANERVAVVPTARKTARGCRYWSLVHKAARIESLTRAQWEQLPGGAEALIREIGKVDGLLSGPINCRTRIKR